MSGRVQVNTKFGLIEGIEKKSRLGTDYISFQRVPYAKPPLGRLRFKDPEPVEPWSETLDCTVEGPSCAQFNPIFKKVIGEEDCLHLNVFTKSTQPKAPYPVMLYVHGGAFMRGSSSTEGYGPDFLIQKDIVLVSFNYRSGAFGFLSIEDPSVDIPGNAGLKDQTMALKWVKENVQFFGGDPNNITLFGNSSGAVSVHFHLLSRMSKNLFHRAILQSGTALNSGVIVRDQNKAVQLAESLGWKEKDGNVREMIDFLRQQDMHEIVNAQEKMTSYEELFSGKCPPFGPVIEPYMTGDIGFYHGTHRTILSRINSLEKGPTFVYQFSFDSPFFNHRRLKHFGKESRGACHADELSYLFANTMALEVPGEQTAEYKVIQTMVDLWTSFAITGNPNNPNSPYLNGIKWEPVPDNTIPYKVLRIDEQMEIVEQPEAKRMMFWDSMYENDQLY